MYTHEISLISELTLFKNPPELMADNLVEKIKELEKKLEIEAALERVRSRVLTMRESGDLLDIVVTMRSEFTNLGHEAHYFWYMRWLPDIYQKAMTSGDGARIGNVMELPRKIHGDIPLLAEWEKSDRPTVVYAMNVEEALNYVHQMVSLGNFLQIDPQAPSDDDIRHIGGLTFVMARTAHGEIGYSLPGVVEHPPQQDIDMLVRMTSVFNLAYGRFLDLQNAEQQAEKIRQEKVRLEAALEKLQKTQAQLVHAEKMASLGELTAGIAHEIQNPLNFVNNFSDINIELLEEMREELAAGNYADVMDITKDISENESKITHHGRRAEEIVRSMLQHSRGSEGVKEPTDINALCDEYLRLAFHGLRAKDKSFNSDFELNPDESIPETEVVPQDIGRVLLNLINNAFQAVSSKSKSERDDYKPKVVVTTRKTDQGIEICVNDNGPGIPEEIQEKIFQPFFTTKPTGHGTGLGLSMSYDIVTKGHGGDLILEDVNVGTSMIIQLPVDK